MKPPPTAPAPGNPVTEALAIDELAYGVWNTPYGAKVTVKSVNVQPNPATTTDTLASPYVVTIYFEPNTLKFGDQPVVENFEPLKFFADVALRGRVDKLKVGKKVGVRGRLKTVKTGRYGSSEGLKARTNTSEGPAIFLTVKFWELEIAGVM